MELLQSIFVQKGYHSSTLLSYLPLSPTYYSIFIFAFSDTESEDDEPNLHVKISKSKPY